MIVTNLKARRSCSCLKIQDLHWAFWWRIAAAMEGELGKGASLAKRARDGRKEGEGRRLCSVHNTTAGSNQKPIVIAQHHCRFKPRTGSDTVNSSHQPVMILTFTIGFWGPIIIFRFEANRYWRVTTTDSLATGSNGPAVKVESVVELGCHPWSFLPRRIIHYFGGKIIYDDACSMDNGHIQTINMTDTNEDQINIVNLSKPSHVRSESTGSF